MVKQRQGDPGKPGISLKPTTPVRAMNFRRRHDRNRNPGAGDGNGAAAPSGRNRPSSSVGELARRGGRLVLWALIGLIFIRGLGAVAAGPQKPVSPAAARTAVAQFPDPDAEAFAVRFARAYQTWQPGDAARYSRTVGSFFSSDVRDRAAAGLPRKGPGQVVAQATVARSKDLGSGRALVTVASELTSGRWSYLTVPVARDSAGGLDVFGLPALSAPPPVGSASALAPDPLTGADAGEIEALVQRFLAAYVSGQDPSGLAYLVAPGTAIPGMARGLALASVEQIGQLAWSVDRMTVEVDVHVRDTASQASYPLAYRLDLRRTDRWYVTGVEGGPQP